MHVNVHKRGVNAHKCTLTFANAHDICKSIFMCVDVQVHMWELSHPDAVKMVEDPKPWRRLGKDVDGSEQACGCCNA